MNSNIDVKTLKTWRVIYPLYMDPTRTIPQGRKMPKDKCIKDINVLELAEMCQQLKLQCVIEAKGYPRDFLVRGRLRVQLKDNETGAFVHDTVHTPKQFMMYCCEHVPVLTNREELSKKCKEMFEVKIQKPKPMMMPGMSNKKPKKMKIKKRK